MLRQEPAWHLWYPTLAAKARQGWGTRDCGWGEESKDWTTRLSAWLTFGGWCQSHFQPFQTLQMREKCTRLQDDVDAWYFPICCDCFCRDGSGGCFCAFCADG